MNHKTTSIIQSERVRLGTAKTLQPALIHIEQGKIAAIYTSETDLPKSLSNIEVSDFGNKVILPGLVDSHVHINEPGRTEWEGFTTATQAAAAGGITTVVDMPLNCSPVTTTRDALNQKISALENQLWVDCGFWGGCIPDSLDQLEDLLCAGVLGVKSFTIDSGIDEFPPVEAEHISTAMGILAKYQRPYLLHAELEPAADLNNSQEVATSPEADRSYQNFLNSRPKHWENDAINMIIDLAEQTNHKGVHAHIVHLSSAEAISSIQQARRNGLNISAETCPHYLTLKSEDIPDGDTLFKCCPPIREDENRQQLWRALKAGDIDFVVSDHSPCTPNLKALETGDLNSAWGGISSLQFGLSLIWHEAQKQNCSLAEVSHWMSNQPAKLAGLDDFKGSIEVGFDADLIVFDDQAQYEIDINSILYKNKITPYAGQQVSGKIELTMLRGEVIFSGGAIIGAAQGRKILKCVVQQPTTQESS